MTSCARRIAAHLKRRACGAISRSRALNLLKPQALVFHQTEQRGCQKRVRGCRREAIAQKVAALVQMPVLRGRRREARRRPRAAPSRTTTRRSRGHGRPGERTTRQSRSPRKSAVRHLLPFPKTAGSHSCTFEPSGALPPGRIRRVRCSRFRLVQPVGNMAVRLPKGKCGRPRGAVV